jgi:hypothetical protein
METTLLFFWTIMIFASIAWYGFLLFYVGARGGRDLARMSRDLAKRPEDRETK